MTYQDALKARARMAYGQVKTAGNNDYNGDKWAQNEAQKAKVNSVRKNVEDVIYSGNGNENALATLAAYSGDPALVQQLATQIGNTKGLQDMNAYSLEDPQGGNIQVPVGEERNGVAAMKENRKAIDEENARQLKNLGYGAGAGALAGLGIGAGAYGLAGLFPSLKKRRLLRALIALGAGAAGGVGVGAAVNAGLNSGAIQGAYGATKDYLGGVGKALKGGK